ncbi:hypothetical protein M885DRAFT_511415 [Pelagophyceae sp. CCMP2097]|nr:hypothetical protein M885DRAFT_511415 [Pelagophyceae sp. CCMP2097]
MSRSHGAFVYRGSGKRQDEDAPPEQRLCTKEACAIQLCLARHNHQQKWCQGIIDHWKACTTRVKADAERVAQEGAAQQGAGETAAPPPPSA